MVCSFTSVALSDFEILGSLADKIRLQLGAPDFDVTAAYKSGAFMIFRNASPKGVVANRPAASVLLLTAALERKGSRSVWV